MCKYRILFKDGSFYDLYCDQLEVNKISDELIFFKCNKIIAMFYINSIAGYILIN